MNLVTVERRMPNRRRAGTLAPGIADAMRRTMSMVPSAMPLLFGGGDPFEFWQPSAVSGFALDLNPRFQVTTGLDGARVTCVSIVNNKSGATDTFTNTGSLRPTYEPTGWGGQWQRASLLGDGASYYLTCSTLASTLVGGTDTPFWLFLVGQFVALPSLGTAACPFFIGRSSAPNPLWDFAVNSSGTFTVFKRGDSGGGGGSQTGGTPDTSKHVWSFNNTATPTVATQQDGSAVAALSGALSAGSALTVDRIVLFSTYAAGLPNNWANFRLARLIAGTGSLATQDITDITAVLRAMYT